MLERVGGNDGEEEPSVYLAPDALCGAAELFAEGRIVSGNAKKLVHLLAGSGAVSRKDAEETAERENMMKIADPGTLTPYVEAALEGCPKAVSDFLRGKTAALRQIVGFVMRSTAGRADPVLCEKLVRQALENMNKA